MMFKKREFATDANNTSEFENGKEEGDMERNAPSISTDELVKAWQRDAQQLQLIVPEFKLGEAVKNKAFANALRQGATVFEAYKEMTAMPKPERKREEIMQNARSARRGTGTSTLNPAKLSSEEFKKYIDGIKNN